MLRGSTTALATVVALAVGCAADDRAKEPVSADRSDMTPTPAAGPVEDVDRADLEVEAASLSDAEVLGTLIVLQEKEIKEAQAVVEKLKNPEVKAFAERIIQDNLSNALAVRDLSEQMEVRPAMRSAEAEEIRGMADENIGELSDAEDPDRWFIDLMVKSHIMMLQKIDTKLLPSRDADALENLIQETVRPTVVRHYREAEQLQTSLLIDTLDEETPDEETMERPGFEETLYDPYLE